MTVAPMARTVGDTIPVRDMPGDFCWYEFQGERWLVFNCLRGLLQRLRVVRGEPAAGIAAWDGDEDAPTLSLAVSCAFCGGWNCYVIAGWLINAERMLP